MNDPTDPRNPPPNLMLGILLTLGVLAALILTMVIGGLAR